MYIACGGAAAAIDSVLVTATSSRRFPSAITSLALAGSRGEWLAVVTDDKRLSVVAADGLSVLDSVELPRRASALAVAALPGGGGLAALVGDKIGDVHAFGTLPRVSARSRHVLGHTGSIVTALSVTGGGGGARPLLLSADRDEKVRVSDWGAPHSIAAFCLGHLRYVSAIAVSAAACVSPSSGAAGVAPCGYAPGELLVSGGGDGALRLWHARTGTLLHSVYFAPGGSGGVSGGGSGGVAAAGALLPPYVATVCAEGVAHTDPDMTYSTSDAGGGGGGGGGEGSGGAGGVAGSATGGAAGGAAGGVVGGAAAGGGDGDEEDAEGDADGAAVVDEAAAGGAATTPGEVVIPATTISFRAKLLPPAVTPAAIVCLAVATPGGGGSAVNVLAALLLGEASVRLLAVAPPRRPSRAACVAVRAHPSQAHAAQESGAACACDGCGMGSLPQARLLPAGTLRLRGGAVPLTLAVASLPGGGGGGAAAVGGPGGVAGMDAPPAPWDGPLLLVGAACPGASGWVHRVFAFALDAAALDAGEAPGALVLDVPAPIALGADAEWCADAASDAAAPQLRLRAVPDSAAPWLAALNAALAREAPPPPASGSSNGAGAALSPLALAMLSNPCTARPAEYDKGWIPSAKRAKQLSNPVV